MPPMILKSFGSSNFFDGDVDHTDRRKEFLGDLGSVVDFLATMPEYFTLPLASIRNLIREPLARGTLLLFYLKSEESNEYNLTGLIFSASVSGAVEKKIANHIEKEFFPIILSTHDWNSGDINWILDIVSVDTPTQELMMREFSKICDVSTVKMHPVVRNKIIGGTIERPNISPDKIH